MPYAMNEGVKLYYEIHGEKGHPVFFIHGGGGNTLAWFQQVPFFSRNYRAILVDLRGFKHSACPPEKVHPQFFADDIRAIMDAEGLTQAAFVCQSLGAWAGLRLAVQSPERVSCLFISGSPTPAYSEANWAILRSSGDIFNSGKFGGTGRDSGIGWNRAFIKAHPDIAFLYSQIKLLNAPFDARTMQDDSIKLYPQDFENYTVPTIIAGGAHDDFLSPESHFHTATLIPGAGTYTFPDAGHSAYFESPDEFNSVVNAFLTKHVKTDK